MNSCGSFFNYQKDQNSSIVKGFVIVNEMYFIIKQLSDNTEVGYYVDSIDESKISRISPRDPIPLMIPEHIVKKMINRDALLIEARSKAESPPASVIKDIDSSSNSILGESKTLAEESESMDLEEDDQSVIEEKVTIDDPVAKEIRDYTDLLIKEVRERELASNRRKPDKVGNLEYKLCRYYNTRSNVDINIQKMYDIESNYIDLSPYEKRYPTSQHVPEVYLDQEEDIYLRRGTTYYNNSSQWTCRPVSRLLNNNRHNCQGTGLRYPHLKICGYCYWSNF